MKRKFDAEKYGYLVKEREEFMLKEWAYLEPKRVNHCQARYYTDNAGWKWLKSYNTIVAVYVPKDDTLYSFGRYSSTTYQHIRKFRNDYLPNMYFTNEVNIEYENWY